jgi:hypothetical protein
MKDIKTYIYKEPKLNSPYLIAAWPGMGGVAIIAVRHLVESLGAEQFGGIEPHEFFDPNVAPVQNNIIQEPEFPQNRFYFWKNREGNDLIIFIGEAQPSMKGYKLAHLILDVAQEYKVEKIYTFAAAPNHIYHTKKPKVLAVATNPKLIPELRRYNITLMPDGSISGMNGLLLGVARERNIDGICLLSEIPVYTTQIPNPRSSKAVLTILSEMLGVEIEVTELDNWGERIDQQMEENINQLVKLSGGGAKKLVDYFERLKQQASTEGTEAQGLPEFKTEELLNEIEQFLKGKREKGDN